MKSTSRRGFLGSVVLSLPVLNASPVNSNFAQKKEMFIHHVYFWLKNPGNAADRTKLVEGLKKLAKVSTIKNFYIGQPADTRREVIDSSYDISWLVFFESPADQDSYQNDPIHLKFVEECSLLWEKVTVYDTVDI